MGRSIDLTIFSVRVKTAGTRREFELLSSFSENDVDLFDELPGLLASYSTEAYMKVDTLQALQIPTIKPRRGRQLGGLMEVGQYWGSFFCSVPAWRLCSRSSRRRFIEVFVQKFPDQRIEISSLLQQEVVDELNER